MARGESIAEIDGGSLAIESSVFSEIEQGLRKNPHKLAVQCMHQSASHLSDLVPVDNGSRQLNGANHLDCFSLTYSQLHRAALSLTAGILANGVQPGSTILLLIPNGGEFSLLLWTSIVAGLAFAAVDSSALEASGKSDLQAFITSLEPQVVVVPDAAGAGAVDDAIDGKDPERLLRISLDGNPPKGWKSMLDVFSDASKAQMDEDDLLYRARNDPSHIQSVLFTSGTSAGQPKGCPQSNRSTVHFLHSQSWLINAGNCNLTLLQAHNSRAIAPAITIQTWREGGTVLMPSTTPRTSFAIEHTVDALTQYEVTFMVVSPAMVHELGHVLSKRSRKLDSIRTIQLGGDTVTRDVLAKCSALFPTAKVCINHGMTEGGGFFTWPFFDTPVSEISCLGEVCPAGAVAPGAKVRIWSAASGTVARRGEPGELHVCCDSIIDAYLRNANTSSFYEDRAGRWFITGDLAMMNDEGLVFIIGRDKDMIKRSGITIMPVALESCVEKYTGTQTSVIAVPHPKSGQEPIAVLSDFSHKSEDDIKDHVIRTLGKDYALWGVLSLEQIGLHRFPVNATHKIVKGELQAAVIDHLERLKH